MNQQMSTPPGFIVDTIEREFLFSEQEMTSIWKKLQLRETFTQSQVFPYRVEFASDSTRGEFTSGELNIHHGPLLGLHGVITEVTPNYRGLSYFYGSYVISFRLVRPVALEFFCKGGRLSLKLKSYVRPGFRPVWRFLNHLLWYSFSLSLRSWKNSRP